MHPKIGAEIVKIELKGGKYQDINVPNPYVTKLSRVKVS